MLTQVLEGFSVPPYLFIFFVGIIGSYAVEVVTIYELFLRVDSLLPGRYKSRSFWLVRSCLAVMGGILAVIFGVQHPLQAFAIGAATPLIVKGFEQARHPPSILQKDSLDESSK